MQVNGQVGKGRIAARLIGAAPVSKDKELLERADMVGVAVRYDNVREVAVMRITGEVGPKRRHELVRVRAVTGVHQRPVVVGLANLGGSEGDPSPTNGCGAPHVCGSQLYETPLSRGACKAFAPGTSRRELCLPPTKCASQGPNDKRMASPLVRRSAGTELMARSPRPQPSCTVKVSRR